MRLAATLLVQEGLDAEQRDFIGGDRYECGERRGWRSGYNPGRLDTAEGRLVVDVPHTIMISAGTRTTLGEDTIVESRVMHLRLDCRG